jgi:hypothetical protein
VSARNKEKISYTITIVSTNIYQTTHCRIPARRCARLRCWKALNVLETTTMCSTKRKAEGEPAEAPLPKHEKTETPLPKHGKRLFVKAILHWVTEHGKNRQCEVTFLVDSGCTGDIINSKFMFKHKLPWVKWSKPVRVTGADGSPIEGAGVRYTTPLTMRIGHHQEEISCEIGQLEEGISGYLPIEWLTKHNAEIDWETGVDQIHWALSYKISPPPNSIPRRLQPPAYGPPNNSKKERNKRNPPPASPIDPVVWAQPHITPYTYIHRGRKDTGNLNPRTKTEPKQRDDKATRFSKTPEKQAKPQAETPA